MEKTGLLPGAGVACVRCRAGMPHEEPSPAPGLRSLLSLVTHALSNVPAEMTVFIIFDAVTVTLKLNSRFQWEERESNIIFLILLLVLKCGY